MKTECILEGYVIKFSCSNLDSLWMFNNVTMNRMAQ